MTARRLVACFVAATCVVTSTSARADEPACALDGVRIAVADAGSTTTVEISARVKTTTGASATCTVAWSRLGFGGTDAPGSTPSVVIVDPFLDHARLPPLLLADGLAGAPLRDFTGEITPEGKVVAIRIVFESTEGGLHLELPRSMFPRATAAAKVERRVKSARAATGRFGELGELPIAATPAGPAGGVGPTGPFDKERVVVECIPTGEPIVETVASAGRVLDGFRDTFAQKVLDLSPANETGWDELARRAYAAAVHGDPVVATLGVSSLAWLAGGLDLKATKLGKVAAAPDVVAAPASVVDAIGDVDARLARRFGAVGRLLPLGRASTFRRLLGVSPWNEAARAQAAKDAVARLAAITAIDLAAYVSTGIMEDTAPIDPPESAEPIPTWGEAQPTVVPSVSPTTTKLSPGPRYRARPRVSRRMKIIGGLVSFAVVVALLAWLRKRAAAGKGDQRDRAY
ncbi:MAG: hypothetical protein ABI175_16270 [Polyangiales bacterium]